ncbi:hypothetical protein BX666DRAFT_1284108 [Dichotomocladium elegans]|nr:hypothetical protein BX666DRAFT_1284108 [Dichotomocladium elegans]
MMNLYIRSLETMVKYFFLKCLGSEDNSNCRPHHGILYVLDKTARPSLPHRLNFPVLGNHVKENTINGYQRAKTALDIYTPLDGRSASNSRTCSANRLINMDLPMESELKLDIQYEVKNDSSSEESIPMLGFSVIPTIASSLDQREPAEKNSALLWLRLLQNGGIYMKSFVEGDGMLREIEQQQMCPLQDCFPLERLRESKYAAFKEQRAEPYRVRLILKLAKAMSEQAAPRVAAKTIPSISALLEQKGPIDVPETLQELLRSCNMENLPHVGLDKIPRANYRIETERWDFRQNVFPSVFSSVAGNKTKPDHLLYRTVRGRRETTLFPRHFFGTSRE